MSCTSSLLISSSSINPHAVVGRHTSADAAAAAAALLDPADDWETWVEAKVSVHRNSGASFDPDETASLLDEAERWRWGSGNYSVDGASSRRDPPR